MAINITVNLNNVPSLFPLKIFFIDEICIVVSSSISSYVRLLFSFNIFMQDTKSLFKSKNALLNFFSSFKIVIIFPFSPNLFVSSSNTSLVLILDSLFLYKRSSLSPK